MKTLIDLEQILIRAIPTFILVWILYGFIAKAFLKPLREVLEKRSASTDGLRRAAESRIGLAEQRTANYEDALRTGSAEIYRQQEQTRQQALGRRAENLRQARQQAEQRLVQARQELSREAEEAKELLVQQSEQMAQWIAQAVLAPNQQALGTAASMKESR